MGLITINDESDGTSADANDLNSRFAIVTGLVNGNIDSANIKNNGVVAANIAPSAVTTDKIASDSVTPSKRSGGFKIGIIPAATVLNTTGNKSITGLGFKPRLVRFTVLWGAANTASSIQGIGAMTETSQFLVTSYTNGSLHRKLSSVVDCIAWTSSATSEMVARYVSMDADGFTINVLVANSQFDVAYEAYA